MKIFLSIIFLLSVASSYSQSYYVSIGNDIIEIDPTTCTETTICNNVSVNTGGGTTSGNMQDIAFHPNGNMYAIMGNYFISIDLATCNTTTISQHSTAANALVADANGNLYAAKDSLYSVDIVTGVFTALGELPVTSGGDLAYYNGQLYLTGDNSELVEVNISNPAASVILGSLGTGYWYGLWTYYVDCNNTTLLVSNGNEIYDLDIATATTTFNCVLGQFSYVDGATMAGDFNASDCGCPVDLGSDTTLCSGSGNLTLDATGTNYTYNWSTGSTSPTINTSGPGTYYVDITETVTGCTNSDTIVITTGTNADAGGDYAISLCGSSGSFNLYDSLVGNPDLGGTWSGPSVLSGGDQGTFDPSSNSYGTYSYIVQSSSGCLDDTAFVTITNNTNPNAGGDFALAICESDPTIDFFTLLTGTPDASGNWSGPSSLTNGHLGSFDPGTSGAGTYYYIVGSASCGVDSAEIVVSIDALPSYYLADDTTVCENQSVQLSLPTGYVYDWDNGASSTNTYLVPGTSIGSSTHYVEITSGVCIVSDSIAIHTINCSGPVSAYISGDTVLCEGSCTDITVITTDGTAPFTYVWSDGFTGSDIHTLCPSATGTYYVVVTDGNMTSDTVFFQLIVNPLPVISISNDTTIMAGENVGLFASGATNYVWSPSDGLSCTSCSNPIASPIATTTYIVTAIENACSSTATVTVYVEYDDDIFIPTAFSPNGDGLNDTFGPSTHAFKSANFKVFDRWGKMVFETTDLTQKWDGMINGTAAMTGSYHYMLNGITHSSEIVELSGNVSLIR